MWFAKYGPLTIINLSRLFECLVCKITLLGIREKTKLKKERNNPLTKGILSPMQKDTWKSSECLEINNTLLNNSWVKKKPKKK